jgi:anti-sigma B factor antagonist
MALELAVTSLHDPRCTLVSITGELDATTSPGVRERLRDLLAEGRDRIVFNVADLAFCDSSGIWLLLEIRRQAERSGGWVRLAGVNGFLLRLLKLTHLDAAFVIDADVAASMDSVTADGSGPPGEARGH